MMVAIDQIDHVLDGHPAARYHALQRRSEFPPQFWPHAYYGSIAVRHLLPDTRTTLSFRQAGQVFGYAHLGQLRLRPEFFPPDVYRWLAKFFQHRKNLATTLPIKQAKRIMRVSVPVRVRPPATIDVACPRGRAADLPGCTIILDSRNFMPKLPHSPGRFGIVFFWMRFLAVSGQRNMRGRG